MRESEDSRHCCEEQWRSALGSLGWSSLESSAWSSLESLVWSTLVLAKQLINISSKRNEVLNVPKVPRARLEASPTEGNNPEVEQDLSYLLELFHPTHQLGCDRVQLQKVQAIKGTFQHLDDGGQL